MANTMPARALGAVERLLEELERRMRQEMPVLLARTDELMSRAIVDAGDTGITAELQEGRRNLERGSGRLLPEFMASLRRQVQEAWLHAPQAPPPDAFPDRLEPLRLLDEAIVDEDAAIAGIAARHESVASLPLLLMGQRFGVLLERPPVPAAELPVGPHGFARALRDAGHALGLGLHARLALYRAADLGWVSRYPMLAEAMDAALDKAGILQGLSYVPLRPRNASSHPMRGGPAGGMAPAASDAPLSDIAALRIVNQLLDEHAPPGSLPERSLAERRGAVSALVRFVLEHGPDSPEWQRCVAVVAEVTGAAREGRAVEDGALGWMREQLSAMGYSAAEMQRLVAGLASIGEAGQQPAPGAATASPAIAAAASGARERRCRERLEQLPAGTVIGFTATGGFTRARLHRREADLLMLVSEENGQEARVDTGSVARLMAEGNAWVVREGRAAP